MRRRDQGTSLIELLVSVTTATVVAALGIATYGRMATANEDARRAAALEQRLGAIRALVARDLRLDGYRVAALELASRVASAPSAPGELAFTYADEGASARILMAAADTVPGDALAVDAAAGFAAGDWVVVSPPAADTTAPCAARVRAATDEGGGRAWLSLEPAGCGRPASGGGEVLRLCHRRYRVTDGGLQLAEGFDGDFRTIAADIDAVDLAREPASGRCALYHLSMKASTDATDGGKIQREASGLVCARNRPGAGSP